MVKQNTLFKRYIILGLLLIIFTIPVIPNKAIIWSHSKTFILFITAVVNFNFTKRYWKHFISNYAKWIPYILIIWISSQNARIPTMSLTGGEIGDGLLFWIVCSIVYTQFETVKNYNSKIIHSLKRGLIIGGIVVVILGLPQLIFKSLDYTIFSLIAENNNNGTAIGIKFNQQPISLFSHKGHLSAICLIMFLITEKKLQLLFIFGSLITQTRATLIIIATILARHISIKNIGILATISLLVIHLNFQKKIVLIRDYQPISNFTTLSIPEKLARYSSSRIYFIKIGIKRIFKRSNFKEILIGYGIPGAYQSKDYELIGTQKYHNIIFDKFVSIGILGSISYILLITKISKNDKQIILSYIIFTLFWFESSQFTAIFFVSTLFNKKSYQIVKKRALANRKTLVNRKMN